MAGQAQWEVNLQVSNNLQELYALAEKLQGQLDNMEKSKHEIKLNINEDELNKAMKNLNKMLDSIGKGTKNFTQFENLSKDIQEAVSSVKLLGSAFGKIDKDTGMSEMLTTIKNIDTSLSSLIGNFDKVKNGLSGVGNEVKGLENAAKAVEKLEGIENYSNKKKTSRQKRKPISDEDYAKNESSYASILDEHLSSGDTVLGGRATTSHLENGLVRVEAQIKSVDDSWKKFSATIDGDGIITTKFSPISKGLYKLNEDLAESETAAKNLSLGDIQDQIARVRKELDLSDAFKIDIDNKGIVTITQSLSEANNVATTTAQTFRNADDAITNFGQRTSDVANKTKVSVKQAKESAKDTTSKDITSKKGNQVTSKDWNNAHKINDALNNTAQLMSNLKLVAPESDFSQIEAQVKSLNQTLISGTIPAKQYRDAISSLTSDYKISADSVSKFKNNTQKFLDSYTNKLEKFKINPAPENQNDAWKDKIAQYEALISKLKAELESIGSVELISQKQIKNISDLEGQIKLLGTEMSSMKTSQKGSNSVTRDSLRLQIAQTLAKYTGMSKSLRAEFEALDQTLAHLGANADVTHLTSQFESLHRVAVETGQATTSLWSAIKDKAFYGLASTIGTYFGLNDVIEGIKKVANTVTDLNTQFTELSKVSDASTSQLYNNFSDFADIAKEVGGTISDTISATSDWSRNGYDLKQSEELARVAQIYKNVGDGIDIDEANSSLISTLQGFKLQADDAEHIIDVFNEVSNHEPIDSSGIGEALQRSAASFNAANTSLEKSVALISGTNSVIQDPSRVGYRSYCRPSQ